MANNTDKMIQWILTDYEYFHAMVEKDPYTLYFLEDTREIYKGEVPYTQSAVRITSAEQFPEYGGNRLYIFENKLYMHNGLNWEVVLDASTGGNAGTAITILSTIDPENLTGNAVSDQAVVTYLDSLGLSNDPDTAQSVVTTADISVENSIGNYQAGTVIPKSSSVQDILVNMFKTQKVVTYNQPTMSTAYNPNISTVSIGASTPEIVVTSTYQQNDAGSISSYTVSYSVDGGAATEVYSGATLTPVTIPVTTPGQNLKITATINYNAGTVPAGTLTKTKTISAIGSMYYVADTNKGATIDAAALETFTEVAATQTSMSVTCKVGDTRVVYVVPAGKTISKITSTNLGYNVLATFTKTENVDLDGTMYNLYVYETDIAFPAEDVYVATIA